MSKTKDRTSIPYRPMTGAYLVRSMILMGCLGLMQGLASRQGFAYTIGQALATGTLGGVVWGWVFWRAWLYKLYPAYLDGERITATR